VKHWCRDLESNCPPVPQTAKKIHGEGSFGQRPGNGGYARKSEYLVEKLVRIGVDSVQDDRDVGEEFGDNVERACRYNLSVLDKQNSGVWLGLTPHGAENELNRSVFFPHKIQTDCNCRLPDHDCPNVMTHTDWRYFWSVEQFEDIHRNEPIRGELAIYSSI
jgi:hypothetical protein